ncbi:TetR/AcrR family transcriptional regulator [Mesoflavibacter sp. CH_XMU1404-2]|uniref:TetR/AcrR family transcriptional regulator n=1 Tax=Mesoflavibacter sp. CH_XMU1404-2 TaxID=3107766 RepID=UPI001764198B|nr:TetR/AcrR family transcriptional regulator [Flavobacteriaceae bacterium]|tara:strand:+ start:2491 stop:3081 length:591 start_codon:yes stop_codon:yes gene_type:complete
MISKQELLEQSAEKFVKFGSRSFTMDELASELGISKKTIYHHFDSKDHLIYDSVGLLINNYTNNVDQIVSKEKDPIICVILLYKTALEHLKNFKPSFIFGLQKYYPKAYSQFDQFRQNFIKITLFNLLQSAQNQNIIREEVNLHLFCDLYFKRFEEVALKNTSLIDKYSQEEILNHFVVYNLRGVTVSSYSNVYFE